MRKSLWIVNGLFIALFFATFVWAGFAIGTPDFEGRMGMSQLAMIPCLIFIAVRRMWKP